MGAAWVLFGKEVDGLRFATGTLANLPQLVAEHEVHAPTLVIVGEVVTLREKLAWFDKG